MFVKVRGRCRSGLGEDICQGWEKAAVRPGEDACQGQEKAAVKLGENVCQSLGENVRQAPPDTQTGPAQTSSQAGINNPALKGRGMLFL
jgi:hypothetical protein